MNDLVQDLIKEFQGILNHYAEEKAHLRELASQRNFGELSDHPSVRRLLGLPPGTNPKIHEFNIELLAGMLEDREEFEELSMIYREQMTKLECQLLHPTANYALLIPEYLRAGLDYLRLSTNGLFCGGVDAAGYVEDLELVKDSSMSPSKLVVRTAPFTILARVKWINLCWQQCISPKTEVEARSSGRELDKNLQPPEDAAEEKLLRTRRKSSIRTAVEAKRAANKKWRPTPVTVLNLAEELKLPLPNQSDADKFFENVKQAFYRAQRKHPATNPAK